MASPKRIVCLSNVHDENYEALREEFVEPCLSSAKRRELYKCLELATGRQVVLLSSPPRARTRRSGRWLPPVQTRFSGHTQYVCRNWDGPKLRVPLSWFFYTCQALRQTRSGDVVVIDNYEIIYIIVAWWLRIFRRVRFVLEYEDGKHLISSSPWRVLNGLAELFGRPLVAAALLAHPSLGERLPLEVPTLLVPGFITQTDSKCLDPGLGAEVQLLYSGSLDQVRGVDLLLEALPLFPVTGWHLHITGQGELEAHVRGAAQEPRWEGKVTFHGVLSNKAYSKLIGQCHVGLNCQRTSDPISAVTFPSKIFSYLSSGLVVVSSRASEIPAICGEACLYYEAETAESLAGVVGRILTNYPELARRPGRDRILQKYTVEGTAGRIRELFGAARLL